MSALEGSMLHSTVVEADWPGESGMRLMVPQVSPKEFLLNIIWKSESVFEPLFVKFNCKLIVDASL
jgi:hypothetical protein